MLLSLSHVSYSFASDSLSSGDLLSTQILDDVSLTFSSDQRVGIIGPSGSGKTTLLKLIAGIISPDAGGSIHWSGGQVPSLGFLFQEGGLFDSMTVHENVAFAFRQVRERKSSPAHVEEESHKILGRVGLSAAQGKFPSELSGGMRKRVGIARALVHSPEILLLDDPTAGLDPVTASVIMDLIYELAEETDCAVLMVSHDLRRLIPRIERLIMLDGGKVVFDAPSEALLRGLQRSEAEGHAPAPELPSAVAHFIHTRYDIESHAGSRQ